MIHKPDPTPVFRLIYLLMMSVLSACTQESAPGPVLTGVSGPVADQTATVTTVTVDLLVRGGTMLSMVADEPALEPLRAIVIDEGRITRIIRATETTEPIPDADSVIDAGTDIIMPGLIDSHVHFHPWTLPATVWRRGNLHYGVTTIMDTGPSGAADHCTGDLESCDKPDPNEWIAAWKDYLNNSPESDGPTLYITGMKLDGPDEPYQFSAHRFRSLDEIPPYLDMLSGIGVDAIKVEKGLPFDYRQRIVEESGKRGLFVVGHSKEARETMAAGQRFIEHMWPISRALADEGAPDDMNSPDHDYLMNLDQADVLIQELVGNSVYLNPTMTGRYGRLSDRAATFAEEDEALLAFGQVYSIGVAVPGELYDRIRNSYSLPANMEPETERRLREGYTRVQEFLRRFSAAGGYVLAATDNIMVRLPGITMHREMRLLADAGITPYRILLGATRWRCLANSSRRGHSLKAVVPIS